MDGMVWEVEYTDTFGGQANYSWVDRQTVEFRENEADRATARRLKAAVGLNGVRGRSYWHGDEYEFRPYGSCTVMFARLNY